MTRKRTPRQFYARTGGTEGDYVDSRGQHHHYHSKMEFRRMRFLDTAGLHFRREPIKIAYTFDGRRRSYTPDLAVYDRWGLQLLRLEEIKPRELYDDPQNQAKWRAAAHFCQNLGVPFCVITEREMTKL